MALLRTPLTVLPALENIVDPLAEQTGVPKGERQVSFYYPNLVIFLDTPGAHAIVPRLIALTDSACRAHARGNQRGTYAQIDGGDWGICGVDIAGDGSVGGIHNFGRRFAERASAEADRHEERDRAKPSTVGSAESLQLFVDLRQIPAPLISGEARAQSAALAEHVSQHELQPVQDARQAAYLDRRSENDRHADQRADAVYSHGQIAGGSGQQLIESSDDAK
jgi:hypothetical protein